MLLALRLRDLLIATWPADRDRVARALPRGVEPAEIDGRPAVSLVAFRVEGGRLGRLPVPPFPQLNARTYVTYRDEPAVFFLQARVTLAGMGGALLGAPYRPARLRLRPGAAVAPGLGISIRYRLEGMVDPGELGRHELGLYEAAGLRAFRVRRGEAEWERAAATEPARADLLLALGFDLAEPPSLLYAERASFEADVPPRRVR